MIWWILLGILLLLLLLPLGASVCYDQRGLVARLLIGPLGITLFPQKKKEEKKEKKKTEEKPAAAKEAPPAQEQKAPEAAQPAPAAEKTPEKPKPVPVPDKKPEKPKPQGGRLTDFLPLVHLALDFIADLRYRLHIDVIELKLILAGDDPYDLAQNYGNIWAALGNLWPRLEEWFVIKKRSVEVECDFEATETLIVARLDMTVTLWRLLSLLGVYGFRAVKEYLKIRKLRKGGAVK